MKVKISEDQNTLTVDGVEYEAKTGGNLCYECSFWDDNNFGGCSIGSMFNGHCAPTTRRDGKSIFWAKVEPKQDDKKAIAIFSDNETVLKISNHGKHDGTYEAKENDTCYGCFFYQCTFDFMLGGRKCISSHRQDEKSIIWIKKEAEQMTEAPAPAPAPHRHFDLIVAWAKDTTQPIWLWSDRYKEWNELNGLYLVWHEDKIYALGDKPTSPPMKKLKVKIELDRNEFEIEVPYDARPQEVDKVILDMATQFMVVTQKVI